ncbi:MAG: hypothetical protein HY644_03095 [Acidobacteria bacterium]|nr:hypothetical protein [Acidobacteriota bacterium]
MPARISPASADLTCQFLVIQSLFPLGIAKVIEWIGQAMEASVGKRLSKMVAEKSEVESRLSALRSFVVALPLESVSH